jgi:hypothetical protein
MNETEGDEIKIHIYNFFITEGHHDLAKQFKE